MKEELKLITGARTKFIFRLGHLDFDLFFVIIDTKIAYYIREYTPFIGTLPPSKMNFAVHSLLFGFSNNKKRNDILYFLYLFWDFQ